MNIKINLEKTLIEESGIAKLIGVINDKEFEYNVHFGNGFTFDVKNNLKEKEELNIIYYFQDSNYFDKVCEFWESDTKGLTLLELLNN